MGRTGESGESRRASKLKNKHLGRVMVWGERKITVEGQASSECGTARRASPSPSGLLHSRATRTQV